VIIFISLAVGLFILVGISILFYRKSLNIFYLLLLFLGLFIVNFFSGNDSLHLIITFIIVGASAGYTFRISKKLVYFIFISSLSLTLIFSFNHYYLKNFKNTDLLMNSKETLLGLLKENNISDIEKKQIIQRMDETLDLVKYVVPFAYFLNAFFLSLAGLYFLKYIFRKLNINKIEENNSNIALIDGIERFKIKEYLIFVYIAGWFVVLLVDRTKYDYIYITGLNVALVLSCFYLIQAFGIMKYMLAKKNIPFSLLPAAIFAFLFLGMEYFFFILIILSSIGVIDFWVDFRKLQLETKKS
jgi:hypothetical protein